MSSGGGGSSVKYEPETVVRYAPYIERNHKSFLDAVVMYKSEKIDDSPFESFTEIELEAGFFGAGESILSSAALYDVSVNIWPLLILKNYGTQLLIAH